jgi:hypothetical protein
LPAGLLGVNANGPKAPLAFVLLPNRISSAAVGVVPAGEKKRCKARLVRKFVPLMLKESVD